MALVLPPRVLDTSTTTGTGAYTLAGAFRSDYQALAAAVGDGNTCYCDVWDDTNGGWEEGLYTVSGSTLVRTTIHKSSNANAAVSWPAGTRKIAVTRPAEGALLVLPPSGTSGSADGLWLIYSGSRGPKLQASANGTLDLYDASTPSTLNGWSFLQAAGFASGPAQLAIKADGGDSFWQITDFPVTAYRDLKLRSLLMQAAGYVEGTEMTAPGTPAANGGRLYFEDNGSGKTRLVVKWDDGTTSTIATQP